MKPSNRVGFVDIVNGEYVRFWIDCYGNEYMAVNKYGFRVLTTNK